MGDTYASVCGPVTSAIRLDLPLSTESPRFTVVRGQPVDGPEAEFGAQPLGPGRIRLTLPWEADCEIDMNRRKIIARPATGLDEEGLGHVVADHILPRVASERLVCLHAAAVAFEGLAFVLAGPSGAGKSTLAARLARGGAELLGDDCAAIEDGLVMPSYRPSRVRMEALPALGLSELRPHGSGKVRLDERHGVRIATAPVPLSVILLVGVQSRTVGLAEALTLLAGQCFHLGQHPPRTLLDLVLDVLERHGPIHEIDRRHWSPDSAVVK